MTIPLERLRDVQPRMPAEGEVTLVVARHQAARWPSPEVSAYAHERARLIHELVDDTGVTVVSWGETDSEHPREIVEILVAIGPAAIAGVAAVLAAWITGPRKTSGNRSAAPVTPPDTDAPLPGIALRRSDGAVLRLTYRDHLPAREIEKLTAAFIAGSDPL